ncbi:peptidoglycan-recognition protein SB1-like [Homalodisca vitripennis]|uniref:peptidoglycan-recognition protein SB1-like n=1 Tax=Homalodisca vitripennis TaxID=197043 RepID=UPI001EEBFC28|nr:peptidoglycan-recognition protein SB1-like [Homalodisca vitripennis]
MPVSYTLLLCLFTASSADVVVKARSEWGAAEPTEPRTYINGEVPFVIIHHSGGNNNCSGRPCSQIVRNIQHYHMHEKNWADIGYNFLVAPTGEVFEGRGWGIVGAHAVLYNHKSVGICLIGDYHQIDPPQVQMTAAKELIMQGVSKGKINRFYKLIGHRQIRATTCPGDKLYNKLLFWPRFTPDPNAVSFRDFS